VWTSIAPTLRAVGIGDAMELVGRNLAALLEAS
jgi:hypothetical protein